LGRTGFDVSVIGMGCWQLGGDWGDLTEGQAMATLHAAADAGVTFFDTADVYGDGRSERLVGRLLSERSGDRLLVATKCGRRVPQDVTNYTASALREWAQRSRDNLGLDTLPLTQLHCPPDEVYENDAVFEALDTMVSEGILRCYGVSVETVAQGLRAVQRPGVTTVQVILNAFRLKPLRQLLPACEAAGVGVIARVPLASGLLTGKYDMATRFPDNDHRTYNRHGEAFDMGEAFSGVSYEVGLQAARELQETAVPEGWTLAELALRWCADAPGVSTVIPGARTPAQAQANAAVASRPPLPKHVLEQVRAVYDERVSKYVEDRW
jgi:aryl-alcohol dehydrogenase-like predicted oxidoreductase